MHIKMKICLNFKFIITLISFVIYARASAPVLTDKATNKLVQSGKDVILSCSFQSIVTFSWLKNGNKIAYDNQTFAKNISQTLQVLNIKNVQDTATYTCVGKNTDGISSGDINVTLVDSAPNITNIDNVYLKKGESHTVKCTAQAIPDATYTWSKESGYLDRINVDDEGNGKLYIKGMREQDEGTYICTAANKVGKSQKKITLSIARVSKFITRAKNQTLFAGQEFYWTAKVVSNHDDIKITWFKDGNLISDKAYDTAKVGALYTTILRFSKLDISDSGNYETVVDLPMVSGFKQDMQLTVFGKPDVQIAEGNAVAVTVGETIQFLCSVKAYPVPVVRWLKNGTVLFTSSKNDTVDGETTLRFQISDVTKEEAGQYECHAKNTLGEGKAMILLEVKVGGGGDDSGSNTRTITVIVVLSVIAILLIALAVFLYIRYKDKWCGGYDYATGTFYTDLNKHEKHATLAELENNPHAIKKNINISIRKDRNDSDSTMKFTGSIKRSGSSGFSLKRGNNASVKRSSQGNIKSPTTDSNYAPLDSIVCQGKAVDFKRIVFDEILGEGEYGCVTGGRLLDESDVTQYTDVSIKMLKDDASAQERRDILTELRMMRRIARHRNVVELIGWCITDDNVYVIEEYVPFGNLLAFLRTNRVLGQSESKLDEVDENDRVDQNCLLSFALQIACGMEHLSQLQVVHRDLACRNIYLSHEKTCKISEYGLQRDIYAENVFRKTTGGQLPVRWMAYESVFQGVYTTESDVWSFGILLWELCTLGKIPYPGIVRTEQLLDELESGYHMENPGHISTDYYLLINSCWNRSPETRPTFANTMKTIKELKENGEVHINLPKLFNEEYESEITADDLMTPTNDFHRRGPFGDSVQA